MSESRQKFLQKGTFIAPVLKMTDEEKIIFRKKVSEGTKAAMNNPETKLKCSKGRKGKTSWNKGIPQSKEAIKKRLITINKHYSKEQMSEWSSKGGVATALSSKNRKRKMKSNIEIRFLNDLENQLKDIGIHEVMRWKVFKIEGVRRVVDGYIDCFRSMKFIFKII
jgi:hypothetical protein